MITIFILFGHFIWENMYNLLGQKVFSLIFHLPSPLDSSFMLLLMLHASTKRRRWVCTVCGAWERNTTNERQIHFIFKESRKPYIVNMYRTQLCRRAQERERMMMMMMTICKSVKGLIDSAYAKIALPKIIILSHAINPFPPVYYKDKTWFAVDCGMDGNCWAVFFLSFFFGKEIMGKITIVNYRIWACWWMIVRRVDVKVIKREKTGGDLAFKIRMRNDHY